ncbi:Regulator of G-protein signaling rgs-6 [Dirofilaria immitis]
MICNETCRFTPFRSKLTRRTYSSIRCSRQTQRTQLETIKNRNLNEEQHQYLHQGCHTISEECISIDQSIETQNSELYGDISATSYCIFSRGPTQLRDSRRKTAEQWRSRKNSLVNDEYYPAEVRRGQKVKFSSANNNKSFLRNLRNILENKESVQIPAIKHSQDIRTHLAPSFFSSSTVSLKSKSCSFESNFCFVDHSDSLSGIKSSIQSKELYLKSAGLDEIQVNISEQSPNLSNGEHDYVCTLREMNRYRLPLRKKQIIDKDIDLNDELEMSNRQRTISFASSKGSSIITSTKVKERKKKAIRCIGSTNLEQFHTFGYGTNSVFTNSGYCSSEGFCNKDADNVLNDLLKDEEYGSGTFENVFRSSDINYSACSECCKVIQPTSSETEQHTVISAIHADEQLDKLVESMVMANGGSEARSSSNQTVDRTCIDVEKILHNELYRRPFQQFLEQQFCAENINFYMAVEEYRSIPDSNLEKRAEVARQIFERYFAPNGIEPVNIDNSTSKSIRDAVMSGNFTPQLYDVAQYQIFHLLKYDCWPRYLRAGGVAPTIDDGPDGTSGTPTTDGSNFRKRRGDKKRKSLIWHGLRPRFSRWKKAWSDASDSLEQNCDHGSSALVQETAEQYASPQFSRSQPSSRHSSQEQLGSSGEAGNAQDPLFVKSDSELRTEMLSKYSSLRRRGFTAARKQRLLLTETIHSDAPPPSTSSSRVTEVCTKFCTLMLDDTPCVEQIALHDPTESVGKWTATVAAQHGMDPRATEVVDAQSGATIDPARQAIDALNNRCVRLLPVLHFAAEIMIPNASNKTGTSANSRIVLLRARHGLSLNAVLRPVLAKYLIDYDSCVVVLPSSFDAVSWQTTVGTIRQRFVLVMTQQKYQERRHSPKREIAKEFHSTQFSTPAVNLPFYQHGDVAFVELPADFDLRTGKMNATRSFSNSKTDHTSGLLKFVRKASQAVTNREPSSDSTGPSSSSYQQHALSVQQQRRQHSGGHSYSQLASSSYTDEIRRKSLGTFQRTTNTAMADIPYCGEDTAVENLRLPETLRSTDSRKQKQIDGRERMFEIPEFLRKETTPEMRDMDKKLALIDSNTPKIPSLYTSTVSSDKDFSPGDCKGSLGWQRADYV